MKKALSVFMLLLFTGLFSVAGIVFFRPLWILSPRNLALLLEKTHVLKKWSWREASFEHEWVHWNERIFRGHFRDFCLEYENESAEVKTCLTLLSWNFKLLFNGEGVKSVTLEPLTVRSPSTNLTMKEDNGPRPKTPPPDIWGYWQMAWSDLIPDLDLDFRKVSFKELRLDVDLKKDQRELSAHALGFHLKADPGKIVLSAPKNYPLPEKEGLGKRYYLRSMRLLAVVEEAGIKLLVTGSLEALMTKVNSFITLPLKEDLGSVAFRKKVILATSADFTLDEVKENLKRYGTAGLTALPAPLGPMDGTIRMHLKASEAGEGTDSVWINGITDIDLKSPRQAFALGIRSDLALDVRTFKLGSIILGLDFRQIALQLPRFSKKSLPPQFFPDGRIKNLADRRRGEGRKQAEEERPLLVRLKAQGEKALSIVSNLLDEPLRLNIDLSLKNSEVDSGYVDILPFKTEVFKRPIQIPDMRIAFKQASEPVIKGQVIFPLPEYKVKLDLEGPISKPRPVFSSEPPLPQSDIYAVLLFGRPMADLDPQDTTSAQATNKILSQGILSLSVLYFLAGSPVEYIGFDPESGEASAQIGLGKKSSLRVGRSQEGGNTTGLRRSLGKGWYLDTSVQNSTSVSNSQSKTYGVLLERIIAY